MKDFNYYYKKYGVRGLHSKQPIIHSEEIPNVILYGSARWLNENGKLHRWSGPAIIWETGPQSWYFHDDGVAFKHDNDKWSGKFYDWTVENNIDIENVTDEDTALIKLVWMS